MPYSVASMLAFGRNRCQAERRSLVADEREHLVALQALLAGGVGVDLLVGPRGLVGTMESILLDLLPSAADYLLSQRPSIEHLKAKPASILRLNA